MTYDTFLSMWDPCRKTSFPRRMDRTNDWSRSCRPETLSTNRPQSVPWTELFRQSRYWCELVPPCSQPMAPTLNAYFHKIPDALRLLTLSRNATALFGSTRGFVIPKCGGRHFTVRQYIPTVLCNNIYFPSGGSLSERLALQPGASGRIYEVRQCITASLTINTQL